MGRRYDADSRRHTRQYFVQNASPSAQTDSNLRIGGQYGHTKPVVCGWQGIINLGDDSRKVAHTSPKPLYTQEVDMLGRCIREGRLEAYAPAMTWADSLGQQETLERWRKDAGVVFEGEKPQKTYNPLPRCSLD
jgi:hypothetical protein